MKKDVRIKIRPGVFITPKRVQQQLVYVLQLADELKVTYQTYPQLRSMVGEQAWQRLSDRVYEQVLRLNLDRQNDQLRHEIVENIYRLEDISASTLVRDQTGLRDTLARVLQFRITNGEAFKE